MYVSENDASCPFSEAEKLSYQLPSLQNFYTMANQDHGIFAWYAGEELASLYLNELTTETSDTVNRQTVEVEMFTYTDDMI